VLGIVLHVIPASRLLKLRPYVHVDRAIEDGEEDEEEGSRRKKKTQFKEQNLREVLQALGAYTERHLRRTEELLEESWLVEYTLREMDEVLGGGVVVNGRSDAEDVVMV